MRHKTLSFLMLMISIFAAAAGVTAQDTFADSSVAYSFALPDQRWKVVSRPSPTNPNVELVFGDRRDGHLEVRKITVAQNALLGDVIQGDEQKRQFLPGYVAGKEENFAGNLRGSVFNFEYVQAGKSMAGRYYFLRANPTTVYVLRFAGNKDMLRGIRNQVDSMARTFNVKQ
jgi:hypothetical protein